MSKTIFKLLISAICNIPFNYYHAPSKLNLFYLIILAPFHHHAIVV